MFLNITKVILLASLSFPVLSNQYSMRQSVIGVLPNNVEDSNGGGKEVGSGVPVGIASFAGMDVSKLSDGDDYAAYIPGSTAVEQIVLEKESKISSITFSGMGRLWAGITFYDAKTGKMLGTGACPSGSYNCSVTVSFDPIVTNKIDAYTAYYFYMGEMEIR